MSVPLCLSLSCPLPRSQFLSSTGDYIQSVNINDENQRHKKWSQAVERERHNCENENESDQRGSFASVLSLFDKIRYIRSNEGHKSSVSTIRGKWSTARKRAENILANIKIQLLVSYFFHTSYLWVYKCIDGGRQLCAVSGEIMEKWVNVGCESGCVAKVGRMRQIWEGKGEMPLVRFNVGSRKNASLASHNYDSIKR